MRKRNERLIAAILETADDLHDGGIMDDETHAKITMRYRGDGSDAMPRPMTGMAVRAMRERTPMNQAVFARHL